MTGALAVPHTCRMPTTTEKRAEDIESGDTVIEGRFHYIVDWTEVTVNEHDEITNVWLNFGDGGMNCYPDQVLTVIEED